LWHLQCKLSLRDLAAMVLERGFVFTHEAVRDRAARFCPAIEEQRQYFRAQIRSPLRTVLVYWGGAGSGLAIIGVSVEWPLRFLVAEG